MKFQSLPVGKGIYSLIIPDVGPVPSAPSQLDIIEREAIARVETIDTRLAQLTQEYERLTDEIGRVSELVDDGQVQEFAKGRAKAADELRKLRADIVSSVKLRSPLSISEI